ncbi:unnamed protein product [Lepidochelys kempii]
MEPTQTASEARKPISYSYNPKLMDRPRRETEALSRPARGGACTEKVRASCAAPIPPELLSAKPQCSTWSPSHGPACELTAATQEESIPTQSRRGENHIVLLV